MTPYDVCEKIFSAIDLKNIHGIGFSMMAIYLFCA
jgi:hypothetical protein